jgi:hypothetical protein
MNEWLMEWMNDWVNEWMNEWMNEWRMNGDKMISEHISLWLTQESLEDLRDRPTKGFCFKSISKHSSC